MDDRTCLSYVHGTTSDPLVATTLLAVLDERVKESPDKDAFVFLSPGQQRKVYTYRQLKEHSETFAFSLIKLGLTPGDHIAIAMPNSFEYPVSFLGVIRAGGVPMLLSLATLAAMLKSDRLSLEAIMMKHRVKGLILTSNEESQYFDVFKNIIKKPEIKFTITFPKVEASVDFRELLKRPIDYDPTIVDNVASQITFESKLVIFLTSGTTGIPKGVPWSHHNLLNNYTALFQSYNWNENSCIFNDRPLSHRSGTGVMVGCLIRGCKLIVCPPFPTIQKINPLDFFIKVMETEKCDSGVFFPFLLYEILRRSEKGTLNFQTMKSGVWGGQRMDGGDIYKLGTVFQSLICGYGTTEISITGQRYTWTPEQCINNVGTPLPHVELKIVDDQENVVPCGTIGEIFARSYRTAELCYIGDQEKTMKAKAEGGWFKTGDLGYLNERGFLTFIGRKDEVIKHGDNLIYPSVIESFYSNHPQIAQIQIVSVVNKGEPELCACIIPKYPGPLKASDLKAYTPPELLKEPQKVPEHFLIMESFPRTAGDKFDRTSLARLASEALSDYK